MTEAETEIIKYLRYISPQDIFMIMSFIADGQRSVTDQKIDKSFFRKLPELKKVQYIMTSEAFKVKLSNLWREMETRQQFL